MTKEELCHVIQRSTKMTFNAGYHPMSPCTTRGFFKALSRRKITPDYYDCHVRREAFVGPRRYDVEQPRFFRLTLVHAMNLRVLRSLGGCSDLFATLDSEYLFLFFLHASIPRREQSLTK